VQALDGLTVLDCATFVAAPFCCTLLGEFGATVIKIEQPKLGDDLRRLGRRAASGQPDWWLVEARNKKSITCNLRMPEGQALLKRLVATADVLAENFRPGTMERWGLGWEDLSAVNRGLVMVRISAFGQTGPARERPGFGRIAAAVSGASYLSGHPDRPPVSPGTPTIPDYLAGVFGAFGALTALRHRDRTGEGQVVDIGLYEPMLRMLDELIPVYGATGYVRERIGSATEYVVPHNHYQTRDGAWIAIACTNDRMFARLATKAMGEATLVERYPSMTARLAHREEVDRAVAHWVGTLDAVDALARLDAAEVPCSRVASVRDIFEDAQVKARRNVETIASPLGGLLHMAGIVPRLALTPGAVRHAGPLSVGQDNEEIYGGRLGLTQGEMAELRARGVI
jgi:crotonobetainyl-CoA:carnitine CoA-transferase CaiB-like acyl-CoA transferase